MAKTRTAFVCFLATLATFLFMASPALAGPGNGNGNGNGKQASEQDTSAESSEDSADSSTPGNSGNAPGRQKQRASEESSSSDSSNSEGSSSNSQAKESESSGSSANSPAPDDPQQGKPAQGCDQADEGYDHPYASTCDGSPSQNGNGGGNGSGKPCAGCVGAADNKNPPGQYPDGSDHNNGYECDGNNGIGKTNPAHTGCQSPPVTPPPPPPPCDGDLNTPGVQPCPPSPPQPCDKNPNKPGVQPCITPPLPCDKNPNKPGVQPCVPDVIEGGSIPDIVLGGQIRPTPDVLGGGLPEELPRGALLPVTGAGAVSNFLLAALGLITAGLVTLRRSRRRR